MSPDRSADPFQQKQLELYGPTTEAGHAHIPTVFVRLAGTTTMRTLNSSLCKFYGHPGADSGNADVLGTRAATAAFEARTRLIIVDDLNFINIATNNGREAANHFKWMASAFQATFLFIGVGLKATGLLSEGLGPGLEHFSQTARRWTRTTLQPFAPSDPKTWRKVLLAYEKDLILADKWPGMLADDLAEYVFDRTTGHFQSLATLISRGCNRAISTGDEKLTEELLESVRNDAASEDARKQALAGDEPVPVPRPRSQQRRASRSQSARGRVA